MTFNRIDNAHTERVRERERERNREKSRIGSENDDDADKFAGGKLMQYFAFMYVCVCMHVVVASVYNITGYFICIRICWVTANTGSYWLLIASS